MKTATTLKLAALTLALVTTACGTAPTATAPTKAKTTVTKKVTKTATVKVIEMGTVVAPAADEAAVKLEFSLGESRQLLAVGGAAAAVTLADKVHHVEFTLSSAGLPAPLTASVAKAKFLNGKAVLQFNNLPAGAITVKAVAKAADGSIVIESNGTGSVKVGELTHVKMTCVVPPTPNAVGHIRIEMDCFSEDCAPKPQPTPTSFVPDTLKTVQFRSLGDPHEDGANGAKFENQLVGTFQALTTLTNDLSLVKAHVKDPGGRWPDATVNGAIAIKSGNDVFCYYLYGHRARLNGVRLPLTAGQASFAKGGMKIARSLAKPGMTEFTITTLQGDSITIEDRGHFLNIIGKVGTERVVHEVRGSFGTYNNGTVEEGMLLRNGKRAANLNAFLNDWRVTPAENILLPGEALIPAGSNTNLLEAGKATS